MKTHVWIKGMGVQQYAPIASLVLAIKSPPSIGETTYFANDIVITKDKWGVLKEQIGPRQYGQGG